MEMFPVLSTPQVPLLWVPEGLAVGMYRQSWIWQGNDFLMVMPEGQKDLETAQIANSDP